MILLDTRVQVAKNGLEDFTSLPPGTGPFKVVEFTTGMRYVFARNEDYWEDDGPWVDKLEFIGIADNNDADQRVDHPCPIGEGRRNLNQVGNGLVLKPGIP